MKMITLVRMGNKICYSTLPTRAADLEDIHKNLIIEKIIVLAPSHQKALEQLQAICFARGFPSIEPIPDDREDRYHCGVIPSFGFLKRSELLYNTVFFGYHLRTDEPCVWFYWNPSIAACDPLACRSLSRL